MSHRKINPEDIVNYETIVESPITITSESLDSIQFTYKSGDFQYHWDFFKYNYYHNTSSYPGDVTSKDTHYFGVGHQGIGTHYNKFNNTGRLISIPRKYYTDNIVPGTFVLRDSSISSSVDSTRKPILKDDGRGNIYSTNPYISQSNNNLSSSTNHIGNIFYEHGLVVLKETGSWSGSVSYMDIGKNNYTVQFKGSNVLYTTEYNLSIDPGDFLHTSNPTSRAYISGSTSGSYLSSPFYKSGLVNALKGSGFTCISTINLYAEGADLPVISCRLSHPIKSHTEVPITFKIVLDKLIG